MNEFGRDSILFYGLSISYLFLLLASMPFYRFNGNAYPFENITDLQISELVCWLIPCFFIFVSVWCIGHLISSVFCYAVYFVQRAWYLHKLRKPERIYTGVPL